MSLFFQPEELTLVVENVLQDSNIAAHDSAHSKLNNSKNLEPQQPKFKNNCLKMVNNNLTATAKCNQRIECHQPNLPIQDDDEENDDLEHGNDSQELMASPWYQQGLSRYATRCFTCCPMMSIWNCTFEQTLSFLLFSGISQLKFCHQGLLDHLSFVNPNPGPMLGHCPFTYPMALLLTTSSRRYVLKIKSTTKFR